MDLKVHGNHQRLGTVLYLPSGTYSLPNLRSPQLYKEICGS